ncbi:hypothetical protein WICPIJ_006456 [Wickerhamomyces pijperi]|uniref:Fatty acid hydroxylase domain-containing protein n=1 Tax=Wickerhamomyces pijperi TaxID=599730 RepID=A0A9P8TLD6_WICPI|nr:hypothetical protein WICPIJ_006456 [Wickerhamomyces pijperi]
MLNETITLADFTLTERPSLINGISDSNLSLIAPLVAYWGYSLFFHIIDTYQLAEKYRIHPPEEVTKRNKASRLVVLRDVLFQHVIQTLVGWVFSLFDKPEYTGDEVYQVYLIKSRFPILPTWICAFWYYYGWSLVRIVLAFGIVDTWQYMLHRLMHVNKALYRRFHSRHHQLYVPYAYGALFNDPVEGFLLDTLGTGIAAIVTCLNAREQLVLFTFSTLKTVDDHCGYALPFDPFQRLFPNNSIYHDIHHQQFGIKTNFSQPFFTFWDVLMDTRYKELDQYREKQKAVTIQKYKEFLHDREVAKAKKREAIYGNAAAPKNEKNEDSKDK